MLRLSIVGVIVCSLEAAAQPSKITLCCLFVAVVACVADLIINRDDNE